MANTNRWGKRTAHTGDGDRDLEHERKRRLILRTAARSFSAHGFHETSIDDIAKKLKVTKPTVYYYVKSKDAILYEAAKMGLDDLDQDLKAAEQAGETGRDRLRTFFDRYGELIITDFGLSLALTSDRVLRPASRRKLRDLKKEFELQVLSIIEQGIADGSLKNVNAKMAAYLIFGAFNWIPQWYREDGTMNIQEISENFMRILEGGITNA